RPDPVVPITMSRSTWYLVMDVLLQDPDAACAASVHLTVVMNEGPSGSHRLTVENRHGRAHWGGLRAAGGVVPGR
ncbi:MAG: hypothetical protein ABWY57_17860, partial [Mycetocola sp.]